MLDESLSQKKEELVEHSSSSSNDSKTEAHENEKKKKKSSQKNKNPKTKKSKLKISGQHLFHRKAMLHLLHLALFATRFQCL